MTVGSRVDQERSRYALRVVKEIREQSNLQDAYEYGQVIRKLPTMILLNGFGQAIAFLVSKSGGSRPTKQAVNDLAEWILQKLPHSEHQVNRADIGMTLLTKLVQEWKTNDYRHAEQEALRLLTWMKMFADAFLPEKEETDETRESKPDSQVGGE